MQKNISKKDSFFLDFLKYFLLIMLPLQIEVGKL